MSTEREPLIYVTPIERVVSSGFVQHDLRTVSSLFVVRPGVDPVKDLEALLELFRDPQMQATVDHIAQQHRSLN